MLDQDDVTTLRTLAKELELMIDGKVPVDYQKVQAYNELARHLKTSKGAQ